jgi:MFS family permease
VNPAPPTTSAPPGHRRTLPGMRVLLGAFAVLTALATGALYVLAETTAETFAWTIEPPLTAAFIGAGYAAGFVLVVLSLRDPVWAHSRVAVLTIFGFVVLTLAATLLHVNRMHFDDDFTGLDLLAKGAAWFWLAVYIVIPVAMAVLLVRQERMPGEDPPPRHPVPVVLRVALALESAVLLVVGGLIYVDPTTAEWVWPWVMPPFTARIVAAWLLAFGLATALAAVAGDLRRLRTAAIAYTVFGALVLLAVARFPSTLDWDQAPAWIFIGVAVAVVLTGAAGWRAAPPAATRSRG